LEVDPFSDEDRIRNAFRRKSKALHPDHGGDPESFRAVLEAYEFLTDKESKAAYDGWLRGQGPRNDRNQAQYDSMRSAWYKAWAEEMARYQFRMWVVSRVLDDVPSFVCNACGQALELLEADLGKGWARLLCRPCKAMQVYQRRRLGGWKLRYLKRARPKAEDRL